MLKSFPELSEARQDQNLALTVLQGYLAHEKLPPARTLHQAYAQGPTVVLGGGGQFLMSEVPLYMCPVRTTTSTGTVCMHQQENAIRQLTMRGLFNRLTGVRQACTEGLVTLSWRRYSPIDNPSLSVWLIERERELRNLS